MRKTLLVVLLLQLLLVSLVASAFPTFVHGTVFVTFASQNESLVSSQPIYIRLQTQEDSNVTLWESIPQNMSDHVATISVNALAIFISSNAKKTGLYRDDVGNLWLSSDYSLKKGDYITTLAWISAQTLSENLTIPDFLSFPQNYTNDIQPFLNPGIKIPADNVQIKQLAQNRSSLDMIQTVENILNFVNETQTYDREKIRLLMDGTLNTPDILGFINDPLETLREGRSFCFERALLATAMLRAVGVPARTFTNADLKTWVQVWLPQLGWVDGDVLSFQPQPQPLFPRSLSVSVPRMVENSSDAAFPFTWLPKTEMRVANLTFASIEQFDVNEFGTVLCQPTSTQAYASDPDRFSFPIVFEPETIQAALTYNNSDVTFHISKGEENSSKRLSLGVVNNVEFEGLSVSFKPILQSNGIVALTSFSVQRTQTIDYRILTALIVAVPILLISTYYWRRKRIKN